MLNVKQTLPIVVDTISAIQKKSKSTILVSPFAVDKRKAEKEIQQEIQKETKAKDLRIKTIDHART